MSRSKMIRKADAMTSVFALILIMAGVTVSALWLHTQRHLAAVKQAKIKSETLTSAKKQINILEAEVVKQKSELLASRSVGNLLNMNPGPWMPFIATWYDGQEGINGGALTAVGKPLHRDWSVAVDPSLIPLGSIIQVRFPNHTDKIYQALDVGGAIRGHRIDIYEANPAICFKNGVEQVEVRILIRGNVVHREN